MKTTAGQGSNGDWRKSNDSTVKWQRKGEKPRRRRKWVDCYTLGEMEWCGQLLDEAPPRRGVLTDEKGAGGRAEMRKPNNGVMEHKVGKTEERRREAEKGKYDSANTQTTDGSDILMAKL